MLTASANTLDIESVRAMFPVLHQHVNGKPLIYFDNAATTQKPSLVLNKLRSYYEQDNANIHRGIHTLAERATADFEQTRSKAAAYLGANESEEVIFTYGTTDGINLVAQAYGRKFLKAGDEVLVTVMEHHSNIVPWQIACQQTGAILKVVDITDDGTLDMESFYRQLSEKTKIVSIVYVSNALGTINPVQEIIQAAHAKNAVVLLDAAQATSHIVLDVKKLNCDFLVCSGHKMYGPTGVGILYGKRVLLEKMDPYRSGGEMIKEVSFKGTTYNDIPYKFEAGTPNIADVVALHGAFEFMETTGLDRIAHHENVLMHAASERLASIPSIKLIGTSAHKTGVVSFTVSGVHHFDMGMLLDTKGIAVRTGHHCTQPLMERLGIEGTIRASFAVYNTIEEVAYFCEQVAQIILKLKK